MKKAGKSGYPYRNKRKISQKNPGILRVQCLNKATFKTVSRLFR